MAQRIFNGGFKFSSDCTSAGGTVVLDGSIKFCKFDSSSCPANWFQYNNWSGTQAKTCTGTNDTTCTLATNCTTGSHVFANTALETCSYKDAKRYTGVIPNTCCDWVYDDWGTWYQQCYNCSTYYDYCSTISKTCSANVAAIGCY
jgi:hypothetical protein